VPSEYAPLVSDFPFSLARVGGVTPAVRYSLIDLPAFLSPDHSANADHTPVAGATPLVLGVVGGGVANGSQPVACGRHFDRDVRVERRTLVNLERAPDPPHCVFMFCSCYDRLMRRTIQVDTERLRQLRRERALSQRALAREAGIGLDTVNKLETGLRDALPVTLRKLADALGVEPRELMKGE
jgi:DNA-binding XRE family transcriptional regulator